MINDYRRILKIKRVQKEIDTDTEFARRLGWSLANYSNKMRRGDLRLSELEKMADVLDCDLQIDFIDHK